MNMSLNTGGLDTARLWLNRGLLKHDCEHSLCHVRMACRYDHPETLEFLEKEANFNLIAWSKGLSSIEYAYRRGSYKCFLYLLGYYIEKLYF